MATVSWLICKESWYGAQTTIYCAVDESLESETGKYYRLTTGFSFVCARLYSATSQHIIYGQWKLIKLKEKYFKITTDKRNEKNS